ncbi:hypothetical protein PKHYL_37810 [Psychrobacter sp. KH172YL61]|nr:hypothetical protein PKHYL_37810 [Psychrobacter sp. KH172YL61]
MHAPKPKVISRLPIGTKIQSFNALDIPVIANGEIWSAAQANDCMMQAGTSHLMLGRGAVTRPDLVAQVDNYTENHDDSGKTRQPCYGKI